MVSPHIFYIALRSQNVPVQKTYRFQHHTYFDAKIRNDCNSTSLENNEWIRWVKIVKLRNYFYDHKWTAASERSSEPNELSIQMQEKVERFGYIRSYAVHTREHMLKSNWMTILYIMHIDEKILPCLVGRMEYVEHSTVSFRLMNQ